MPGERATPVTCVVDGAPKAHDEHADVRAVSICDDPDEGTVTAGTTNARAEKNYESTKIEAADAVLGVYGVKSYVVSRRMREFGIRIAVGARPRALLWQVLREGGRVTTIGIGIGLLLALGAGQFLQGMLYGVNGIEPVVLVTAPLILLAASLLASHIPALRATRVDPTVALRSD